MFSKRLFSKSRKVGFIELSLSFHRRKCTKYRVNWTVQHALVFRESPLMHDQLATLAWSCH